MKKTPKWLMGCGIGCGAIVILGVGFLAISALYLRGLMADFETATETRATLEERFGAEQEFIPWPDGGIPADRIEAFLRVRDATEPVRARITSTFSSLPLTAREARELDEMPFHEKMHAVWEMTKGALGLGSGFGEFFQARNTAMLEAGMGMGEYSYIYVLAYNAWLGHPMAQGPGSGLGRRAGEVNMGTEDLTISRIQRDMLAMLRNQRESLPSEATEEWRRALDSEIAALEEDEGRVPWRDGMPEATAASLSPYRERLEGTYSPMTNVFELARSRKSGPWSYTVD